MQKSESRNRPGAERLAWPWRLAPFKFDSPAPKPSSFDFPTFHENPNSKPYERTNQAIEKQRSVIFVPTKCLKIRGLSRYPTKYLKTGGLIQMDTPKSGSEPEARAWCRAHGNSTKVPTFQDCLESSTQKCEFQKPYERTQYVIENKCDDIWAPSMLMKKMALSLYTQYIYEKMALTIPVGAQMRSDQPSFSAAFRTKNNFTATLHRCAICRYLDSDHTVGETNAFIFMLLR